MEEVTRRRFFGKVIAAIAGVIALGWGIPILEYLVLPAFRSRRRSWSEVDPVDKLEVDHPKELELVSSQKNGWMETHSVQSIWAFRKPDGQVVVYSRICPHLDAPTDGWTRSMSFTAPATAASSPSPKKCLPVPPPDRSTPFRRRFTAAGTSFFRVEQGEGEVWIDGAPRRIKSDMAIIIPAGARHNIKKIGGSH